MRTQHATMAMKGKKTKIERIEKIPQTEYEFRETKELVMRVRGAAALVAEKGEKAFGTIAKEGSPWRTGDDYVFVIDPDGNMLVHPDPALKGMSRPDLKDINGKPIIEGLLKAATGSSVRQEGWYHYQWPEPGGLMPRWKSSFVEQVTAPSGKHYVVGSGMYNDRMERAFVVDIVQQAAGEIEKFGRDAFRHFHDPAGPFLAKDAYIFVIDMQGVEWVNPAFPNIEGKKMLDRKDTNGKLFYHDMIDLIRTQGSGWIEYMWPKPGESVSTKKSAYVKAAQLDDGIVIVGCGVYLSDAPSDLHPAEKMNAAEVMSLVRKASLILHREGEKTFASFRKKGSEWFRDGTYLFIFDMNGTRILHPAEPESEGRMDISLKDNSGKPIVKMILEAASGPSGEGWVHYMYPEPGDIFPVWKSSFVKRVRFPSGKDHVVGCGIYRMRMEKAFIEDLVERASAIVAAEGRNAFPLLRDKKGPFVFMDTYVFVQSPEGIELVNPMQPALEGRNLMALKDLAGKEVIREEIEAAMTGGKVWKEIYWYKPGDNIPARKLTCLRKVQHEGETFIVGSGLYLNGETDDNKEKHGIMKMNFEEMTPEPMNSKLTRVMTHGERATVSRFSAGKGASVMKHAHEHEEIVCMQSGSMKFTFDDRTEHLSKSDVLIIPPNTPHAVEVMEDSVFLDFFTPVRTDWQRGDDKYLRHDGEMKKKI